MNTPRTTAQFSPEELDDAAVWIARLRAPDRSTNIERGFRRWLDEKPTHAAAYDTISTAWELTGSVKRRPFPKVGRWERAGFRAGFAKASLSIASLAALALVGGILYVRGNGVATGIGEQRILTLGDGSRITLNTSTRVRVQYDEKTRLVELKDGKALFDVNKDPRRPFIVTAHQRQIRALGTSFLVRDDGNQLAVTLMEGRVAISMPGRQSKPVDNSDAGAVTLVPGQRLIIAAHRKPTLDTPAIEKLIAWRRGQLEFDDTTLAEAVAEVNRYSTVKLEVERPETTGIRINGVFRAGDVAGFAAAVSRSYGLIAQAQEGKLVLK